MNRVMEGKIVSVLERFPLVGKRLDAHMQEVVAGASVAFVLKLLAAGFAFGFNVVLARLVGVEGAGVYFLSLMAANIAVVLGLAGLNSVVLRHVAAGVAADNWAEVKGVYTKGMAVSLAASCAAAVVMFATAPLLAEGVFHKPELTGPIRWMSLSVVPVAIFTLQAEALRGLKRIAGSIFVSLLSPSALSIAGVFLLAGAWGVVGAVWAYVAAAVLTAFAGMWLWKRGTAKMDGVKGHFETGRLMESSMPLFWMALMQLVTAWISTFILGVWGTKEEVGIFSVANRTSILIAFVLIVMNTIVAPKFAELYRKGDMQSLGVIARSSVRMMALMATPVFLVFVMAPGWVMGLFGQGFKGGSAALMILSFGQFINVATGSVGLLLIMSGNERAMRNNVIFATAVSLLLNIFLTPVYGVVGAAVATAVSVALINLTAMVLVKRYLSIRMW